MTCSKINGMRQKQPSGQQFCSWSSIVLMTKIWTIFLPSSIHWKSGRFYLQSPSSPCSNVNNKLICQLRFQSPPSLIHGPVVWAERKYAWLGVVIGKVIFRSSVSGSNISAQRFRSFLEIPMQEWLHGGKTTWYSQPTLCLGVVYILAPQPLCQ